MTSKTRIISLGVLAALCAVAFAAQDALTLKYTPKVGDTFKYKLSATMDFMGTAVDIEGTVTDKVTAVADNGDYTVESAHTDQKGKAGEQDLQIPDDTSTTKYKSTGEIIDIQASQSDPDQYRLANMTNFIYPTKPVKVGDEWSSTVTADSTTHAVPATCSYKVVATEKVGSHDTVKIHTIYKESEGSSPASSEGDVWLDVKDGQLVKGENAWTNAPLMGQAINGKVKMERQD